MTLADIRQRREQILRLAQQYRVGEIRIFGSVARGSLEPWSDVDFVIEPLPGHSLLDRAGLIGALRELLGVPVDIAAYRELREPVRIRADAEAVAL